MVFSIYVLDLKFNNIKSKNKTYIKLKIQFMNFENKEVNWEIKNIEYFKK